MHASVARLVEFASRKGQDGRAQAADLRALTALLDVTPAVMTNWKGRGISKEGALSASKVLGCSANWVLTGEGDSHAYAVAPEFSAPNVLMAIQILGAAIECATEGREDAVNLLRVFIGNPSANRGLPENIAQRLLGGAQAVTLPAKRSA